jgi:hypothetical protein
MGSDGDILGIVFIFLQLLEDVSRLGDIKGAFSIIPYEVYAVVQISIPIFGELMFLFDGPDEVVNVFLTCVFHSKIVDN